jgi:hypothetical protein
LKEFNLRQEQDYDFPYRAVVRVGIEIRRLIMALWFNKPVTDPEKQFKKLKKYCKQVLRLNDEEAEKKAREWLGGVGHKAKDLEDK